MVNLIKGLEDFADGLSFAVYNRLKKDNTDKDF